MIHCSSIRKEDIHIIKRDIKDNSPYTYIILMSIKLNNFGTQQINGPRRKFHSFCCTITRHIFEPLRVSPAYKLCMLTVSNVKQYAFPGCFSPTSRLVKWYQWRALFWQQGPDIASTHTPVQALQLNIGQLCKGFAYFVPYLSVLKLGSYIKLISVCAQSWVISAQTVTYDV